MSAAERLRPVAGRVPPQDLDAEAAVLSAILLVPATLDRVRLLAAEHFYSDSNRRIFEAILELDRAGRPVDVVTLMAVLRDHDRLQQIGGSPYIAQLVDATPAVAHIEAHALVVREKWRLRRMIENCQRLAAEGYGDTGDVQMFLESGERALSDIAHAPGDGSLVPLARVLDRTHAYLQTLAAERKSGAVTGAPTGYRDLDKKTSGLHDGDFTVVAGRPGHGKTSFVLGMLLAAAMPHREITTDEAGASIEHASEGRPGALFSLEMPAEQLGMRILSAESRVDLARLRHGWTNAEDWKRIAAAMDLLSRLPIWIDDSPAPTMAEIRSRSRRLQAELLREHRPRLGFVAVDYLQLVQPAVVEKIPREQQVAAISKDAKRIAKELGVPFVMLSALNREIEKRSGSKKPQLSDLRESGAIEFDADNVIFVHRPELISPDEAEHAGIAEIIVGKQRNGPTGTIRLRFDKTCTRFDNLAEDEWGDFDERS